MTEYEELRKEIASYITCGTLAGAYTMADRILSIIADKCWLKNKKKELPFDIDTISGGAFEIYTDLLKAGWQPVKEIKREVK